MDLSKLLLPVILVVIILGYYNFLRFGSFFNNGYFYDHKIIKLGIDRIFDWKNIPMQLYYFLYKPPHFISRFPYIMSDLCGHSILLTSPVLILIYFRFKKNLTNIIMVVSSFIALIPSFLYWNPGCKQIGYRFVLDALPFLLVLLIFSLRPALDKTAKILILSGAFFNLYLIYATLLFK